MKRLMPFYENDTHHRKWPNGDRCWLFRSTHYAPCGSGCGYRIRLGETTPSPLDILTSSTVIPTWTMISKQTVTFSTSLVGQFFQGPSPPAALEDMFGVLPVNLSGGSDPSPVTYIPPVNDNQITVPTMSCVPLPDGCEDHWTWSRREKSHEVRLQGERCRTAHFHPNWSNGTAGVRGTRILNRGRFYWEIRVSQRIFGTSMMFGIGTNKARLHVDAFVNLLGEDQHSWGLSHKGLLWHNGKWRQYTKPFRENEATTVGLLFNGYQGTLTYFKDGVSLGVAFTDLDQIQEPLYPMVCSTAAKTEMTLGAIRREYINLQDRCRAAILRQLANQNEVDDLYLPNRLKAYLIEGWVPSTKVLPAVPSMF